ncbi:MAG: type 1 glutamine amidotransferase [bacterium]
MRCLAIVHERDAGPGVFAEAMAERGAALDEWLIAESDRPPADPFGYDAVFTFGGAMHPDADSAHVWMAPEKELLRGLLAGGVPLMGSCLGTQLLGESAGAGPRRAPGHEIGWFDVEVTPEGLDDPVIGPMGPTFSAFQWHSYEVPLPPGAVALATSPVCLQAWRLGTLVYGIQFHAEVAETDAHSWIRDYGPGSDAVDAGVDLDRFSVQTRARIGAWNRLGRGLCDRFLDLVASRRPAQSGVT